MRPLWIVAALGLPLSGCLVDLYGGDPRLQFKNSSAFLVRSVGIGDPDRPAWKHDLNPVLKTGKSSEVIDLPAAGDLHLWVLVSDTGNKWDTLLVREMSFEVGNFEQLEITGETLPKLSTSP